MSRFSDIDLAQLPVPAVVHVPDYLALVEARKIDIIARVRELGDDQLADTLAATLAIEGELITKLVESGGYRQTLHYARVNDAARAVMLAYAVGNDLDHLGAFFAVKRFDGETDERFRRRIQLAPEALSVAGPEGAYIFHAMSADLSVKGAKVLDPEPGSGRIDVIILTNVGDGVPAPELLEKVRAVLVDDKKRPLTDVVSVRAAVNVPYVIDAKLTMAVGPDAAVVLDEARNKVAALAATHHEIGAELPLSAITAALFVPGVTKIDMILPLSDIVVANNEAPLATSIEVVAV